MSKVPSLDEAYQRCRQLADSHYENFPVAKMVPKNIRKHVAAVYAFARTADDIADEEHESIAADDPARIEKLKKFEAQLDVENQSELDEKWNWIFIAVADTVKKFDIPKQLLRDLISAVRARRRQKKIRRFSRTSRLLPPKRESRRTPRPPIARNKKRHPFQIFRRHLLGSPARKLLAGYGRRQA